MSCPNCERLREELIGNVKNMKSQFDGSGLIREGHNVACDSIIRVIDALALPSEEVKALDLPTGKCPVCHPPQKFTLPKGMKEFLHGAPVKKETEESYLVTVEKLEPLTISLKVLNETGSVIRNACYKPDMEIILSRINAAERSTTPKDCGREEAMLRVVDAAKKYKSHYRLPFHDAYDIFIYELEPALDALEALEKLKGGRNG